MRKHGTQAQILNIKLDSTSENQVLKLIREKVLQKQKFIVFTPNPEIILSAQSDPDLASILNSADLSIPDGVGLKLAEPSLTIIKGRELMVKLFELGQESNLKIFLLGASSQVNKKSLKLMKTKYPHAKVKGSPGPYLDKNANPISTKDIFLEKEIIIKINEFKPDFLFVAFGTPKEQKWIAKHVQELNASCIMEVGGSLDYFSGATKLPPAVFSKVGLEWLWRLIQEPLRFGRIFNALVLFPLKIIKEKIFAQ